MTPPLSSAFCIGHPRSVLHLLVILTVSYLLGLLLAPVTTMAFFLIIYPAINGRLVTQPIGISTFNASQLFVTVTLFLALSVALLRHTSAKILRLPRSLLLSVAPMILLGLWSLPAILWAPPSPQCLPSAFRLLLVPLLLLAIILLPSRPRDVRLLAWGAATGSAVTGVLATLQKLHLQATALALLRTGTIRTGGGLGGPVTAGTLCMAGTFIAAYLAATTPLPDRLLPLCLAAFSLAGIASSFSRTAILGLGIFLLVLLAREFRNPHMRLKALFIVTFAVLVALLAFHTLVSERELHARTRDVVVTRAANSEQLGSGRGRLWRTALAILADAHIVQILFGHGTAATYYLNYERGIRYVGAHNSYLEVLIDLGIIGLVLYCTSIYSLWRFIRSSSTVSRPHTELPIAISMASLLAYYLSTDMFNQYVYMMGPRLWGHLAILLPVLELRLRMNRPEFLRDSNP